MANDAPELEQEAAELIRVRAEYEGIPELDVVVVSELTWVLTGSSFDRVGVEVLPEFEPE